MNKNSRHLYKCAFTKEELDITRDDTVMIAGNHNNKEFQCFVLMDKFFELFVCNPEVKMEQIPGLMPYKNRHWPKIRFRFDPVRFGSLLEKWRGAGEIFCSLIKD